MGSFFTKALISVMERPIQTTRNLWTMTNGCVRAVGSDGRLLSGRVDVQSCGLWTC